MPPSALPGAAPLATSVSRFAPLLAISLVACTDLGVGGDDTPGEMCHVDCFGGAQCEGDELRLHAYAPHEYPCDDPPADINAFCVWATETCPLGCRADTFVSSNAGNAPPEAYAWLCLPQQPRMVGSPCWTDDDCHPTFAIPSGYDALTQEYLACGGGGTCEVAPAPVVPGYGDACAPGPAPGFDVQWIEGAGADEACLYAADFSCTRSFATITCSGDWVCPAGSRCDTSIPRAGGGFGGVCRPGTSVLGPSDLPCTSGP